MMFLFYHLCFFSYTSHEHKHSPLQLYRICMIKSPEKKNTAHSSLFNGGTRIALTKVLKLQRAQTLVKQDIRREKKKGSVVMEEDNKPVYATKIIWNSTEI